MASSRPSTHTPDSVDVLAVMSAFEEMNRCSIEVVLGTQKTPKIVVLQVTMRATVTNSENGDRSVLASHQSTYGYFSPMSLDTVILQGLYNLDAAIARREFATTETEKRSSLGTKS